MRKSIRSELRMLREMVWHFGLATKCHFCKKPLLKFRSALGARHPNFGDSRCPPVKTKLGIHHKNENHKDNSSKNRKPCHSECHRRYHMKKQHERGKL